MLSRQQGLKTAVIEGHDIGGTCVNRGCVPSKALLAASGRVRELQSAMHLKALGIQVSMSNIFCVYQAVGRLGVRLAATNIDHALPDSLVYPCASC